MTQKRSEKTHTRKIITRKMVVVLAGLLALTAALALRWADPEGLKIARFLVFDRYQQVAPRHYEAAPVRVIAIDEESRHRVTILRRNPVSVGTVTVAYSLDDNQLVRYSTTEAYAAPDRVLLLENIAVFRTQVLSQRGWVDVRELQDSRAMAIEISIERTSGERYRKVMPL